MTSDAMTDAELARMHDAANAGGGFGPVAVRSMLTRLAAAERDRDEALARAEALRNALFKTVDEFEIVTARLENGMLGHAQAAAFYGQRDARTAIERGAHLTPAQKDGECPV